MDRMLETIRQSDQAVLNKV